MHVPRVQHAIALMQDGRVLVAGGREENPFIIPWNSAEAYDPVLDTWTLVAPMPFVITRAMATTLQDGRVVVVGAQGAVVYDPAANAWATIVAGVVFQDVQPLADGGALLISATSTIATGVVENAYRLDPATLTLSLTDPVPAPTLQTWPSVGVVLADDAILMTGGLERQIGGPNVSSARVTRYGEPQPGSLAGAGQLIAGTQRFTFQLDVSVLATGAVDGRFRLAGMFVSDAVTSASFSGDGHTATFRGTGLWNGAPGYTFTTRATDAGNPGSGRDLLAFTIRDPNGVVVSSAAGTINAGNIH
jgi:hypothetical protein